MSLHAIIPPKLGEGGASMETPPDLARGDSVKVIAHPAPTQRSWNKAIGDPHPQEAKNKLRSREISKPSFPFPETEDGSLNPIARAKVRSH
ncbi:hypothetical protein [Pajaroellobacter abortibovis]|uniref:Uncharacterized protein n=1 Tax=Pajaroellobacter abortibovis TaxID=1882918 RepID=A0A1L6MUX3_9BACT|nr:hypothetical protein [Pajaroellobacter abortibovis]APR99312.1 hypothetical protein BCY86_00445 [Pajaroellobacter abortibovis]